MAQRTSTRREVLLAGVVGTTAATAGCSGVGDLLGGDGTGSSSGSTEGGLAVLPAHEALPGGHPPAVFARPSRMAEYRTELLDGVVTGMEHLATARGLLPFGLSDVETVARTHSASVLSATFDRGNLAADLQREDFRATDDSRYVGPEGRVAVAVGDGWLAVGRRNQAASATETLSAVGAARDGESAYTDGPLGDLATALSDADYAVVRPVGRVGSAAPSRGIFAGERAYGVGVSLGGSETTVRYRRLFDDTPTEGDVGRWVGGDAYRGPSSPTVEVGADAVTVSGSVSTPDLSLYHLAGQCRATTTPRSGGQENGDATTELSAVAYQFGWEFGHPDGKETVGTVAVPRGELSLHATSVDVIHGLSIPGLGVQRLLVPGETTIADLAVDGPGTFDVRCGYYCGAGHRHMTGTLRVGSDVGLWLQDANGFDGIVDRRGMDETLVEVGAQADGNPYSFAPAGIRVSPGTTVRWRWVSNTHNIVPETQPAGANWEGMSTVHDEGFTYSHTFDTAGVYKYYCAPHKAVGMKGAVVVDDS